VGWWKNKKYYLDGLLAGWKFACLSTFRKAYRFFPIMGFNGSARFKPMYEFARKERLTW
jgi:hypothetical protein